MFYTALYLVNWFGGAYWIAQGNVSFLYASIGGLKLFLELAQLLTRSPTFYYQQERFEELQIRLQEARRLSNRTVHLPKREVAVLFGLVGIAYLFI